MLYVIFYTYKILETYFDGPENCNKNANTLNFTFH